jgi:hypothetical protein
MKIMGMRKGFIGLCVDRREGIIEE